MGVLGVLWCVTEVKHCESSGEDWCCFVIFRPALKILVQDGEQDWKSLNPPVLLCQITSFAAPTRSGPSAGPDVSFMWRTSAEESCLISDTCEPPYLPFYPTAVPLTVCCLPRARRFETEAAKRESVKQRSSRLDRLGSTQLFDKQTDGCVSLLAFRNNFH